MPRADLSNLTLWCFLSRPAPVKVMVHSTVLLSEKEKKKSEMFFFPNLQSLNCSYCTVGKYLLLY